eukprot:1631875-Pleurochrysis_carterae.AAC.1
MPALRQCVSIAPLLIFTACMSGCVLDSANDSLGAGAVVSSMDDLLEQHSTSVYDFLLGANERSLLEELKEAADGASVSEASCCLEDDGMPDDELPDECQDCEADPAPAVAEEKGGSSSADLMSHRRGKYDRTGRGRRLSNKAQAGGHWLLVKNQSLGTPCQNSCPYGGKC